MRAPILTSPHLGAFLEHFCADPFQGRMTLPVLNPAARSGAGVGFVLHSETSAQTDELKDMCQYICEGMETLLESHQAMLVPKHTKSWELRWTSDLTALFNYRGKAARYWNQIIFGLDAITLRRQLSDHAVSMSFNAVDPYAGTAFNYYIDLEGMAVLSLKRFLGLQPKLSVDHVRVRLYSQWGVPRQALVGDVNTVKKAEDYRDDLCRRIDPTEKEAWMDEASLFAGVNMDGRLGAVEAYVNRSRGYANEVVSIQDAFLEDEDYEGYMRSPLPSYLHELWHYVAKLESGSGDDMLRTSYLSLLQDMYRGKRNGINANRPMKRPPNLRQLLHVYRSRDEIS